MPDNNIIYEKKGHIVSLTLNRPQASNIINIRLANELSDTCININQDEQVRAVILTGAGDVFCSGIDFKELSLFTADDLKLMNPAKQSSSALAAINCPVIAAINGDATGAGLELALACDIRLASEKARFCFPETSYGLIPGGGGTQRLPRIVGKAKALEMILLAEPIDADEAFRIGLVSRVASKESLYREAEKIGRMITARAPIAVRYAKEALSRGVDMTIDQGLRLEADLSILLHTSEDRTEGIKAFIEKRTAYFKGK